jgi:hypothetical protein
MSNPNPALAALRHHVSGAVARGEAVAITEVCAAVPTDTGLLHGPARPTVADVAALYPSYAARGAFLVPLLRIARDA